MTTSSETDNPPTMPVAAGQAASASTAQRDQLALYDLLRSARVSNIIAAHPDALASLIEGGFPLLAQAPVRWAMAHTVNLGQAFRIAGLEEAQQDALLSALVQLDVPANLGVSSLAATPDSLPDREREDHKPEGPEPEATYAPEHHGGPGVASDPHGRR